MKTRSEKFRHADKEYDVRATRSGERVNEAGKRIDALLRFQVLIDGREYRFSLFVHWVGMLIDGKVAEVFGVLLKEKPPYASTGDKE